MRLFLKELQKIWRLPIIVVIVLLNVMFAHIFSGEFYDYGSRIFGDTRVDVLTDLKAEYGDFLSLQNRIDAEEKFLNLYLSELDPFIAGNPTYANAGIYNAVDFWERDVFMRSGGDVPDEWVEVVAEIKVDWNNAVADWCVEDWRVWNLWFRDVWHNEYDAWCREFVVPLSHGGRNSVAHQSQFALQRIYTLRGESTLGAWSEGYFMLFDEYTEHGFEQFLEHRGVSDAQIQHLRNAHAPEERMSLFPLDFFRVTSEYFSLLAVAVIVSVGILLLPFLTRDKHSGMVAMQYSCRKGRRILRTQFAAGMVSAIVLALVQLTVFTVLLLVTNPDYAVFFEQNVFTLLAVRNNIFPLLSITYMQYIWLFAALNLVLAVASAALFLLLSLHSREYVSLLIKAIVGSAALAVTAISVNYELLCVSNAVYGVAPIIGIEFILSGGLLAIGIGLCVFACKRVMRRDLL
jgi:hypothetical protein